MAHCIVSSFNIDTLTLLAARWRGLWQTVFFLALDLRRSVRKTLKRWGNTVKEFSVLREFEI